MSCLALDCTQSLSFLLLIEKLERARCARDERRVSKVDGRTENGEEKETIFSFVLLILDAAMPLARSSLSITADEKRKGPCMQSSLAYTRLGVDFT